MTAKEIKVILEKLNFPMRYITDQTAICIMALFDKTQRPGLLQGHKSLSDGARIHDILNFAREVIGKKVAENTREAYRKTSLFPLMNYGIVVRHQLSTNDPNTYYRLHPDLDRLFIEKDKERQNKTIRELTGRSTKLRAQTIKKESLHIDILVKISVKEEHSLSKGRHNLLEKAVVELFAPAILKEPLVVYLGDTTPRAGYQNRSLMRKLNLPINTAASLPDVILYSEPESHLIIVEVVTSSGPVNSMRLEQLQKFTEGPEKLGIQVSYVTAFHSRAVFRRFIEDIAWGSSVWIENEPNNIVHFERI